MTDFLLFKFFERLFLTTTTVTFYHVQYILFFPITFTLNNIILKNRSYLARAAPSTSWWWVSFLFLVLFRNQQRDWESITLYTLIPSWLLRFLLRQWFFRLIYYQIRNAMRFFQNFSSHLNQFLNGSTIWLRRLIFCLIRLGTGNEVHCFRSCLSR